MGVKLIDILFHLDKYLQIVIQEYPTLTYLFLFLIFFTETGFVVAPFLPGDSLLFTVGALSAVNSLNIKISLFVILLAAVLGDTVNYHIGKFIGPKIFSKENSIFFHKEHLTRAQQFYEKHGKKTIILARFIPIIRTFAPFVAGIGKMSYPIFLAYNVLGALLWCTIFIFGGYFFGNIPFVQNNFNVIIILIIIISFIPLLKEIYIHYIKKPGKL
ncbi:MAG: DedA family protein [Nanoarchaeota archaeon]